MPYPAGRRRRGEAERVSDLARLRARIDRLDAALVRLLGERAEVALAIGRAKRARGGPAFDPGRERAVFDRLVRLGRDRFPGPGLEAIFREIVSASRALEAPTRVSYLGPPGSVAHWAAARRFGSSARLTPAESAESLLASVEQGRDEFAVFSLEGLAEDPRFDAFDLLLSSTARLFGEFHVEGGTVLLGRAARGLRTLYAHPAVLARCGDWLHARAGALEVRTTPSSQEAARRARAGRGAACLGTPVLAGDGLRVLAEDVADDPRERRRFLILSTAEPPRSKRDKTALLTVLPHRPGHLHAILGVLARRKINLLWIETRASRGRAWQHVFLFEIAGHAAEPRVARALRAIAGRAEFVKVLGSFAMDAPGGGGGPAARGRRRFGGTAAPRGR